jgi:hypothetical protein
MDTARISAIGNQGERYTFSEEYAVRELRSDPMSSSPPKIVYLLPEVLIRESCMPRPERSEAVVLRSRMP